MSWFDQLQPASFRGVPFGVLSSDTQVGRRQALHEYPQRDKPWIEDIGRATRKITIHGFLVEDSLIYGGGSVLAQRDRLIGAAETADAGTLVHPSLGRLTVSLLSLSTAERLDQGRYIEFTLSMLESGERVFPGASTSTSNATGVGADGVDSAASGDFLSRAVADLKYGASVVNQVVSTATKWATPAIAIVRDATNLSHLASVLPGELGRYFGGGNAGGLGGSDVFFDTVSSVSDLIIAGTHARALVETAVDTVIALASQNKPTDFATASQNLAAQVRGACADPADAIRLLGQLAVSPTADPTTSSPVGLAMADIQTGCNDLFRRTAVAALARASTDYQPSSYDDAIRVRSVVTGFIDAEILIAGDQGEDDAYQALRILRKAVADDLTERGADLAVMATFSFPAPMPSLVLANRIYRDPSREAGLVRQVDVPHPLFMPTQFRALAS